MKIGRNEPCPCGSGKKFKKCCKSLRILLGTKDTPKNNHKKIGKKEAMLADLLGQYVDHELAKEDLLNIARDDELETKEAQELMKELSQSGDAIEENLDVWKKEYGLPEPDEEDDEERYKGVESEHFYDNIESQYDEANNDGVFLILKIMELDEIHSDNSLVEAVNYFNKMDGCIENNAPTQFLNKYEQRMVNKGEKFRPKLYSMLLSMKFSEALQDKTVFIKHSNKFSF